jgi:2-octaprenyl-3-methyl-6-methoxy-1,4-benzoquinol hydroxylase/2-octaprenylphenol hydroxylase
VSRRSELDVVVVGAGVAGSAMALALVRAGFGVTLVEARSPAQWQAGDEVDPRVVALAPDSVSLLDELGVWPSVLAARASAYRRMQVWDALAPGELTFDAADRGEAALGWIVENRVLQHVLWRALKAPCATGNLARLLCPAEVVAVENESDGVAVELADGTRLRARLLIAADGAASPLRRRFGIGTRDRDYAQRAIVAHVGTERAHQATAWQRFQPGGPLAFLPLSDGRSSIVWSRPDDEAARLLALDESAFRAELGCAFDFRLGTITTTTLRHAFPLRLRLAERYVAGRCVLVGDAAHAVHPLAGQGLNLGLRDVRCLAALLARAQQRGSDPGAANLLRRYERERRSENTLAARGLDLIERSFGTEAMPVAATRGLMLSLVNRLQPLKHWLGDAAAGRL